MNKYLIRASYLSICEAEIEADSEQAAWDIAAQLDGGAFTTCLAGDDWQIDSVKLLED